MAYADRDKIASRSTDFLTETNVPDERLSNAQSFADSEIDSRLAARYGAMVPFDPVPAKIEEIAADLAAYFAIIDLFQNGVGTAPVDYANLLFERAQQALDRLADGHASLPGGDPNAETTLVPPSIRSQPRRTGFLQSFDGSSRPSGWPL